MQWIEWKNKNTKLFQSHIVLWRIGIRLMFSSNVSKTSLRTSSYSSFHWLHQESVIGEEVDLGIRILRSSIPQFSDSECCNNHSLTIISPDSRIEKQDFFNPLPSWGWLITYFAQPEPQIGTGYWLNSTNHASDHKDDSRIYFPSEFLKLIR